MSAALPQEKRIVRIAGLALGLGLVACFSLALLLQPRLTPAVSGGGSAGLLQLLLGDTQRLLASQLLVKADVYFHSGYYPSIFDQTAAPAEHSMIQEAHEDHADEDHEAEHERKMDFLGKPKNWIDRFGRNFFVAEHSHMEGKGEARELLPWLKLAAELDPSREDAFVVTAFWLRTQLGKLDEAEAFLREGWRNNRNSYPILIELGRFYETDRHDRERARNILELALKKWNEQQPSRPAPDNEALEQIVARLARIEEQDQRWPECLKYLRMLQPLSPAKAEIARQIADIEAKSRPAMDPPAGGHLIHSG